MRLVQMEAGFVQIGMQAWYPGFTPVKVAAGFGAQQAPVRFVQIVIESRASRAEGLSLFAQRMEGIADLVNGFVKRSV